MLAMRPAIPSSKSCPIRSRDKKPEMLGVLVMRPPTPGLCRAGASKKPGLVKKNTSTVSVAILAQAKAQHSFAKAWNTTVSKVAARCKADGRLVTATGGRFLPSRMD